MMRRSLLATLLVSSTMLLAQGPGSVAASTLPIVFTNTVSADRSHPGDAVLARTTQATRLPDGTGLPTHTLIMGHVTMANAFVYDSTPYAKQRPSELSVHFDSVRVNGAELPLNITVRAMADPISSWESREPTTSSDNDPDGTLTQIGGDILVPSQKEVVSRDGDVVAYNKHGGVYAHLIANGNCDGGDVEVPVDIFSASACGLYGFSGISAVQTGSVSTPSVLTLRSTHTSPRIWKHSTALLEVLPATQAVASR
jgi:hypothetical protein